MRKQISERVNDGGSLLFFSCMSISFSPYDACRFNTKTQNFISEWPIP